MSSSTTTETPRRRLRWLQVRMVTMLLAVTLCCVGLGIRQAHVVPYMRQAKARNLFTKRRAQLQLEPGQPGWITPVVGKKSHQDVVWLKAEGIRLKPKDFRQLRQMPRLRRLYLARSNTDNAALEHIADLRELERISLWQTLVSSQGLKHLERLHNLQVLDIHETAVKDDGLRFLRNLDSLQHLVLSRHITNEGLKWLRGLYNLRQLDLTRSQVTIAGFKHLAKCRRLRRLLFSSRANRSGYAGLKYVPNLIELTIPGNSFRDRDCEYLSEFRKLKSLDLTFAPLTDVGIKKIVDSCPSLEKLFLGFKPQATDRSLERIAALPQLRSVAISSTQVTPEGIEKLLQDKSRTVQIQTPWVTPEESKRLYRLASGRLQMRVMAAFKTDKSVPGWPVVALDLSKSNATPESLVYLQRYPQLRKLTVSGQRTPHTPSKFLLPLKSLRELQIRQGTPTVKQLRDLAAVKQLRHLTVAIPQPNAEQVKALGELEHLESLTVNCWAGATTVLAPLIEQLEGKTTVYVEVIRTGF